MGWILLWSYVYMQLFVGRILKNNNDCWPFFDVQRFERSNKMTVRPLSLFICKSSFLRARAKDIQQLINGRRIVGIVIKICALLQIFLPILENRELLTHVIATKSMTQMRDLFMTIIFITASKIGQSRGPWRGDPIFPFPSPNFD